MTREALALRSLVGSKLNNLPFFHLSKNRTLF
jgi:hypothetical protein